jgi:DNA-binding response OmpR family regulator
LTSILAIHEVALPATSPASALAIDHVWDYDFEGHPNIVEVYVWHLRQKVDVPVGHASLQTVRGEGYRLDLDGG